MLPGVKQTIASCLGTFFSSHWRAFAINKHKRGFHGISGFVCVGGWVGGRKQPVPSSLNYLISTVKSKHPPPNPTLGVIQRQGVSVRNREAETAVGGGAVEGSQDAGWEKEGMLLGF